MVQQQLIEEIHVLEVYLGLGTSNFADACIAAADACIAAADACIAAADEVNLEQIAQQLTQGPPGWGRNLLVG